MDADTLHAMLSEDGVYILTSPLCPTATSVAVVFGAGPETPGRIFAMRMAEELSQQPENWAETDSQLAGGPFSVQSIENLAVNMEDMQNQRDFWRDIVERVEPVLVDHEKTMRIDGHWGRADGMRDLLETVAIAKAADMRAQMMKQIAEQL